MVIICEEVDTLGQPAVDTLQAAQHSSLRYRLRRATTLEWDCRAEPKSPGWLPLDGLGHGYHLG